METNAAIEYFRGLFSNCAPMLRENTITDDGRCAVMEFKVVGWNGKAREEAATHHAGLACYERSSDGLKRCVHTYDDIDFTPVSSVTSE